MAALFDDLFEEILLRFPPDDPALLVRASLVCKDWCRLISGAGFRCRFREFHRTPPVRGFLCNVVDSYADVNEGASCFITQFVPTSSACPARGSAADRHGWHALDSRHGRVLLHSLPFGFTQVMLVCDPITGDEVALPKLPSGHSLYDRGGFNAAVVCALGDTCNHLDCHRGPFLEVFVGSSETLGMMFTCVCGVLAGNALYFVSQVSMILEYDLSTREISEMRLPATVDPQLIVLITTEDGGLGFVGVENYRLCLWSREVSRDKDTKWIKYKVIELETLLPAEALLATPRVLGFVDGVGVILIWTSDGDFTIDLKSGQVVERREFSVDESSPINLRNVVPYMSFHIPG
ncbi:unnamed protein product [Urochloa decumbens]|uniref:F-box domain-containing protein n=1 Tax=Urochloa decumbens TaxID=240449 RepID=A0ABC9G7K6_9POAL